MALLYSAEASPTALPPQVGITSESSGILPPEAGSPWPWAAELQWGLSYHAVKQEGKWWLPHSTVTTDVPKLRFSTPNGHAEPTSVLAPKC